MPRYTLYLALSLFLIGCDAPQNASADAEPLPDFASMTNVQEKKAAFFGYMLARVNLENGRILKQREALLTIQAKLPEQLSSADKTLLENTAKKFKIKTDEYETPKALLTALLRRVDAVPASLALAQSANESAWGTSRFAKQGSNFFGQWCFSKGCGLVPKQRDAGASHEVAAFANAQASVNAYIRNINTGNAYKALRLSREQLRQDGKPILGHTLAEGLVKYSERGHEYVEEIQAMIRFNKLAKYDTL